MAGGISKRRERSVTPQQLDHERELKAPLQAPKDTVEREENSPLQVASAMGNSAVQRVAQSPELQRSPAAAMLGRAPNTLAREGAPEEEEMTMEGGGGGASPAQETEASGPAQAGPEGAAAASPEQQAAGSESAAPAEQSSSAGGAGATEEEEMEE
jgi:hypothetical protein